MALRWLLQRSGVTAPIIGARNVEHPETYSGASGWSLPDELMKELDQFSQIKAPYPNHFIRSMQRN